MKKHIKLLITIFTIALLFLVAGNARASTPILYLSSAGNDSVNITVTGDSNSTVILYYNLYSGNQSSVLGSTNSAGYFNTTLSSNTYGITPGSSVYVSVNNQQSLFTNWPYSSSSSLSLSQTTINTSVGQYTNVTAYNVSGSLYVSNNSNPSVASVTVSGNTISVYGSSNGNTTATICQSNNYACTSLYITVGYNYGSGSISLSQTSLNLSVGQSGTVTAYNNYGYGSLYISTNTNQGVATASISNNIITIYGSSVGNSTIAVCQSGNSNACSSIYVTVNNGYGYNYNNNDYYYGGSGLNLNISSLSLPVGSSITVYSASSSGIYVSENSNPSVASITYTPTSNYSSYNTNYYSNVPGCMAGYLYSVITGQSCGNNGVSAGGNISIVISALALGSDSVTLCQNSGGSCSTIYITSSR